MLLTKGFIYAPQHGLVAFTVPGMAAVISPWDAAGELIVRGTGGTR